MRLVSLVEETICQMDARRAGQEERVLQADGFLYKREIRGARALTQLNDLTLILLLRSKLDAENPHIEQWENAEVNNKRERGSRYIVQVLAFPAHQSRIFTEIFSSCGVCVACEHLEGRFDTCHIARRHREGARGLRTAMHGMTREQELATI